MYLVDETFTYDLMILNIVDFLFWENNALIEEGTE